jgi:hypothetical protein
MSRFNKVFILLASAWAILFAIPSFYWAAGGTFGLNTLGGEIEALREESWFMAFVWFTAIMKLALGLVVLMLLRTYRHNLINKLVRVAVWMAGILCVLYGGLNLLVRLIMALGILPTPETMYSDAAMWHLVLWDPWWVLGGVVLLLAVFTTKRSTGHSSTSNDT